MNVSKKSNKENLLKNKTSCFKKLVQLRENLETKKEDDIRLFTPKSNSLMLITARSQFLKEVHIEKLD